MVFLVLGGTVDTTSNGLGVRCVSRSMVLLSFCRSTVRRGLLFFFWVATILMHHFEVVPCGTLSMIPRHLLRSRSFFICCFQWWGMGMGMWTADGAAPSLKCSLTGYPVIHGSGWWGHWLSTDDENASSSQAFSFGMFSVVGLKGLCIRLQNSLLLFGCWGKTSWWYQAFQCCFTEVKSPAVFWSIYHLVRQPSLMMDAKKYYSDNAEWWIRDASYTVTGFD